MLDLKKMGACDPAIEWFESYDWESLEQAWCACENGYWLEWICAFYGNTLSDTLLAKQGDQATSEYYNKHYLIRGDWTSNKLAYADMIRKHVPFNSLLRILKKHGVVK